MNTAPKKCPQCQAPLLPNAKFCVKCGTSLKAHLSEPSAPDKTAATYKTNTVPQPAAVSQPNENAKPETSHQPAPADKPTKTARPETTSEPDAADRHVSKLQSAASNKQPNTHFTRTITVAIICVLLALIGKGYLITDKSKPSAGKQTAASQETATAAENNYSRLPYMRAVLMGDSLETVREKNAPYTYREGGGPCDFLEVKELPHSLTEVNIHAASGDYSYHYYLTGNRVIEIVYTWGYGPVEGRSDARLQQHFLKARQEITNVGYGEPALDEPCRQCQWLTSGGQTVSLKCDLPDNSKWALFETKITSPSSTDAAANYQHN
ncbi:MAG: zinc-ribbon domain-containing protein [bacterium]|nr:zinc-ribbon domain-containing protein [bacterium]